MIATARHVVVSIAGCRAHLVACAGQSFREAAKLTKGLACKPQTTGFSLVFTDQGETPIRSHIIKRRCLVSVDLKPGELVE